MTKSIFEQLGGSYAQQGDYLISDFHLPETEERDIGVWGRRYGKWLKDNHRVLYYNLLTKGKLDETLADIGERAQDFLFRAVKELAEQENVTETLKAGDMPSWVRKMNNIRNRAEEMLKEELFNI